MRLGMLLKVVPGHAESVIACGLHHRDGRRLKIVTILNTCLKGRRHLVTLLGTGGAQPM